MSWHAAPGSPAVELSRAVAIAETEGPVERRLLERRVAGLDAGE